MVGKKRFGALAHAVDALEQAREHSPAEHGPAEPRMSRMSRMSRMARAVRVTVASVAAAAMLGAVCVAPASALADVNADAATAATGAASGATASTVNGAQSTADASVAGASVSAFKTQAIADASDDADAMPENPNAALPDKVSSEISDDATVVSEQYAATPEGELKDIETGETVTDPKIVGTESKQPDPLAKTDGESFIPVSAADVKEKVAANGGDVNAGAGATDDANATNGANDANGAGNADAGASGNADGDATTQQDDSASQQSVAPSAQRRSGAADGTADSRASVKLAALQNNEYGAHWGSYNGTQAFFDAHNNLFAQQAKGVIDVSEWQHTIDWQAAKNAGVEGAIIRLSFGWSNGFDAQARRNISECKRLGIPFGVYVFSYAESAADGASEGADVVNLLRQAGVAPGDLSYPVFYDLETWTYTGHKSPTSPSVYEGMVNAWYAKLQAAGYNNLSVYSYTSYLNTALNSASIHAKTRWVAQYGSTMQYTAFPTNDRGWQYTSGGTINGISGRVDLNAFGVKQYDANREDVIKPSMQVKDIQEGDYYIGSALAGKYVGIDGNSNANLARAVIQSPNGTTGQLFHITPAGDGTYTLMAKVSKKVLDVEGASTDNGTAILQYDSNGGANQRWCFYRNSAGYMYIVSAYGKARNKVIDVTAGSVAEGTRLELWTANGGMQQQFRLLQMASFTGEHVLASAFAVGNNLDVSGANTADSASLDIWKANGGENQRFLFEEQGNGLYSIQAQHSGKYLDIYGAYAGDGGRVVQYRWTGELNQLWYLQQDKDGYYAVLSALNNKAIDVEGMNKTAGTAVVTYRYGAQANQKWSIKKDAAKPTPIDWSRFGVKTTDIPDGDYFVESSLFGHFLSAAAGKVTINRAKDDKTQLYQLKKLADGNYAVLSKVDGKALSVVSQTVRDGDSVTWKKYDSSDSVQRWAFYKTTDGLYYIVPEAAESRGRVLDVPGMNTKDGTTLDLWGINGGAQQQFRLLRKTDLNGAYTVSSDFAGGSRLDIKALSKSAGAEAETWIPTKGENQRFIFVYKGNGMYAIKANHSGMVLDIEGLSDADGASVIQYPWGGGRNQMWYPYQRADGSYVIVSAMNNKVLDIYGMQSAPGARVIVYHGNGQANQRWTLHKD